MRSILQKRSQRFDTFYFLGTFLQGALGLAVGAIAAVYAVAFGSACWPVKARQAVASTAE